MITFRCLECARPLRVDETLSGKPVRCPACRRTSIVPPTEAATLPPPSDPSATLPPSTPPTLGDGEDARAPAGYVIEKELGRGGMGVVYKARSLTLKRPCALKMILAGVHSGEAEVERFKTEAQAIARLQHPGIVQVFEIGEHDGKPFMALEFCGGGSLDAVLAKNPLKPTDAAKLVQKLAEAVHAAHEAKVIHRDLKPANVLLSPGREPGVPIPKITDFGLAKKLDEQGATRTGSVMGTPSYMPPEQAEGKKDVGPAADVYALGAILYDCLAARPPFRAATPLDTILQVLTEEPVPLRRLNHQVPADLETIALKCLQKNPARRYPTAQALADDLGRYLDGEPIHARPVGVVERAVKWTRRNRLLAGAVAAVTAALLLGTAVAWWQAVLAGQSADDARASEAAALESRAALEQEQSETLDMLYATRVGLAQQEWNTGISIRARQLLDLSPTAKRGWEHAFLDNLFQPERYVLSGTVPFWFVAVSPDGRWLVTTSGEKTIQVWDAQTGSTYRTISNQGYLMTFARDGRLAFAQGRGVKVFDPNLEREVVRSEELPRPAAALAWSADDRELLAIDLDGRLHRIGAADGRLLHSSEWRAQLDGDTEPLLHKGIRPVFSPDRRFLAQGGGDCLVKVWDLDSGERVMAARGHIKLVGQVAFSPDGKSIASPGGGGEVFVHEVATGRPLRSFRGDSRWVWTVAYSPDGTRLLCGSKSTVARILDAETGETVRTLRGHKSEILFAEFGPGSQQVITSGYDGTCRVWDATDPVAVSPHVRAFFDRGQLAPFFRPAESDGLVFFGHVAPPRRLALSPDGRLAASVSHNDEEDKRLVVVWDLASRRELVRLPAEPGRTITLTFSPDSRSLAVCTAGASGDGPDDFGEVRVFDVETGRERWPFTGPKCGECSAAYRPGTDEVVVAFQSTSGVNELVRLDAATGQLRGRIPVGHPFLAIQFVSDREVGLGLLTVARVRVIDLETGQSRDFDTGSNFTAFAAGGGKVATAHFEVTAGVIRVWDASGKAGPRLEGHVGPVTSLAFSPDGSRLLSGGSDFAARVWTTNSGRQLLSFADHRDIITGVAWSGDGGRIATTCMDGALRVWTAPASAVVPDTGDWPVVYRGDFTGPDGTAAWRPTDGTWVSGDGALTATLQPRPKEGFSIAFAELLPAKLPRQVDIHLELEVSAPMLVAVSLGDPDMERSWSPFVTSVPRPIPARGAGLLLANKRSPQPYGIAGPLFPAELTPGVRHRLRVYREPERVRLFLDRIQVVSERIPPVEMPTLDIQGSWGNAGDTVRFHKIEVRAPQEAIRDRELRSRAESLFARELLREPVRAALEADADLTAAERAAIPELMVRLIEDPAKLLAAAEQSLNQQPLAAEDLSRARRLLEAAARMVGADQPVIRPDGVECAEWLALTRYLARDFAGARELTLRLVTGSEKKYGFPKVGVLAVLGLCEHELGNAEAARPHLVRMRDLDRPEAKWKWTDFPVLKPVVMAARALADKVAPPDAEREAVKDALINSVLKGWRDHDLEGHVNGYTADWVGVSQREEKPGPYDITTNRDQMAATRRLEFRGDVSDAMRFLFDRWEIEVTGDTAVARCRSFVVIPPIPNVFAGFQGIWEGEDRLRKEGGRWKIARNQHRQLRHTEGDGKVIDLDAAYWAKLDAAVTAAANESDRLEALVEARRQSEALALARKLTERPTATARDWSKRATAAKALGEAEEALKAAAEAARLDPTGFPLPYWANP